MKNNPNDHDFFDFLKNDDQREKNSDSDSQMETPNDSFSRINARINSGSNEMNKFTDDSYYNLNDGFIQNSQPNLFGIINDHHDDHSTFNTQLNNNERSERPKQQIPSISNFVNNSFPIITPNSIFFKNTKPAPYAGLLNQGSTCYMNSLLQALFHLPAFRRLVFEIDDENISKNKPDSENIPLNLKLLFAKMQLQHDNKAISTEDLTTSFGWKQTQNFMQHDVQEFSRVLLENLEEKMKGTPLENAIKYIFGGNYITYIYTYLKNNQIQKENYINNEFYDISLDVSSNEQPNENNESQLKFTIDDIYSAFDKYTEEEKLSGDNQYQFEESTKKDAFIRNKFIKLPRVLYLHLKRFQIDIKTNQSVKINSFFRFYRTINLTKYIDEEFLHLNEKNESDEDDTESEHENENENIGLQTVPENENKATNVQSNLYIGKNVNLSSNSDEDENKNTDLSSILKEDESTNTRFMVEEEKSDILINTNESIEENFIDLSINATQRTIIDLNDKENEQYQYDLYGVLVHSGTSLSGHYTVYLKPTMGTKWYQFNDSQVTEVDEESALDKNFGGLDKTSSAYMLIYIKRTDESNLFHSVEDEAIPDEIIERIRKEESKTQQISSSFSSIIKPTLNYMQNKKDEEVIFYLFNEETTIKKNALFGKLSFSCDREYATQLPMYKTSSLNSLHKKVAQFFQTDESHIELWPQFLNEGLIEKLENISYKDLKQYPESMDVFVLIKYEDPDLKVNSTLLDISANNDSFNFDDIFNTNSSSSYEKFSFDDLLSPKSTKIPFFVFIFCPLSKNPLDFLLSYEVDCKTPLFEFLALTVKKKVKSANPEEMDIDYIRSIMKVYMKKNNSIEKLTEKQGEKLTFNSCLKNSEIYKSVMLVIELDDWSGFEIPTAETDSYAMDVYLSQKKKENHEDRLTFDYFDFNPIFSQNKGISFEQYYNYINDLNRVKIISFGKKVFVTFPNLITVTDFKNFLKTVFEKDIESMIHDNIEHDGDADYDELVKSSEILIFRENEVKQIDANSNDLLITILAPNDKKLRVKFIDPTLLLIDEDITSSLLLDVFVSSNSICAQNKVEEFVKNDSSVYDLIDKFFLNDKEKEESEFRVLQLDKKGNNILRVIDPDEKVSSLLSPIRIEKVALGQINSEKLFIKVSFDRKMKLEPFLIDLKNEMKLADIKEIIARNVNIQKHLRNNQNDEAEVDKKENDFVFYFYNEKGEKISNLSNDTTITEISPPLTDVFADSKKNVMLIDRAVHLYN